MWIEVTGAKTGKKILVNTYYVQSVYEYQGDVVIDLGDYEDNVVAAKGTYNQIRDLVTEGEWRK